MSITFCQLHNFWEVGRGTGGSGNGCAVTSKISRKSRLEGCNLKRAPLHCGTDGWDGKETWKQIKIKVNEMDLNVTQNCVSSKWKGDAMKIMRVWFENLASRFLGNRSRVWAREGKSGRSLDSWQWWWKCSITMVTMMGRWRITLNWKANIIIIIIIVIIIIVIIIIITINVYELLWVEEPTLNKDVFHLPARLCNQKWRKW